MSSMKARMLKKKLDSSIPTKPKITIEGPNDVLLYTKEEQEAMEKQASIEREERRNKKRREKAEKEKQTPEQIFESIEPLLKKFIFGITDEIKANINYKLKDLKDYKLGQQLIKSEPILNPYHKLEAYIISNSNITTRSIGKPKNDQIREINGVRFRLKDFKNWYHIIQMFSEAKELFK